MENKYNWVLTCYVVLCPNLWAEIGCALPKHRELASLSALLALGFVFVYLHNFSPCFPFLLFFLLSFLFIYFLFSCCLFSLWFLLCFFPPSLASNVGSMNEWFLEGIKPVKEAKKATTFSVHHAVKCTIIKQNHSKWIMVKKRRLPTCQILLALRFVEAMHAQKKGFLFSLF